MDLELSKNQEINKFWDLGLNFGFKIQMKNLKLFSKLKNILRVI